MKERISFIDISKSFAIILIVLGHTLVHSANCSMLFKFLYSFHVVLFFIISGYTFKINNNASVYKFIKNKFIRIMIPYFVWATLFLLPYMLFGENVGKDLGTVSSFNIISQLKNILFGIGVNSALKQNSALWFLPALFSIEIIYYFIIRTIKDKSKTIKCVILIPLIMLSYLVYNFLHFSLPWGINTALVVGIFFYIGYLLKELNLLCKEKIFSPISIIFFFLGGCVAFYYNDIVSCIDYKYGYLSLALVSGLGLSLSVLYLSYLIKQNHILEYIGKNTMGVLIFHKLIILVFQTKLGIVSNMLRNSNILIEFLLAILVTTLSIFFSLVITEFFKKNIPVLIGEKK